jgi:hypothetical protein
LAKRAGANQAILKISCRAESCGFWRLNIEPVFANKKSLACCGSDFIAKPLKTVE